MIDQGEGADRLALAVFEDLEVFLLQVADELALAVGERAPSTSTYSTSALKVGVCSAGGVLLLAQPRQNRRKRHKRRREPHSSNHGRHPDAGGPIGPDYSG